MTTPDHDPFPELLLARQDDDALGMSMLIYPDRTPARNLFWLTLAVFVLLYTLPWRETYFQACVLTSAIYTLPTVWSWGWQNYAHLDIQTIHLSADNGISSHRIAPIADNGANHLRILPRHTETRYVRSNLDSGVFLTNILLLLVVFAAGYNDISRILRDKTPEIPLAQMWVVEGKTPAEPWVISTRQSTRSYLLIDGVYLNCDFYFEHDACDEVYRFAGKPIKVWYYRNNRRVDAVYAIEIDGQSLHDEHYFRALPAIPAHDVVDLFCFRAAQYPAVFMVKAAGAAGVRRAVRLAPHPYPLMPVPRRAQALCYYRARFLCLDATVMRCFFSRRF